jgi:hypothetical protein
MSKASSSPLKTPESGKRRQILARHKYPRMPELRFGMAISGDLGMRPGKPEGNDADDLFLARLSHQLDLKHPLVRLAGLIDWQSFETTFGPLYHETVGRPGKPTRLMVGLTYFGGCVSFALSTSDTRREGW